MVLSLISSYLLPLKKQNPYKFQVVFFLPTSRFTEVLSLVSSYLLPLKNKIRTKFKYQVVFFSQQADLPRSYLYYVLKPDDLKTGTPPVSSSSVLSLGPASTKWWISRTNFLITSTIFVPGIFPGSRGRRVRRRVQVFKFQVEYAYRLRVYV